MGVVPDDDDFLDEGEVGEEEGEGVLGLAVIG